MAKSQIYFPKNTPNQIKDLLGNELGISHNDSLGKYLGVFIKDNYKVNDFQFLVDKLKKRVQNWISNFLSFASYVILIKFVLSALPLYHLACSKKTISICLKLNQIVRNFCGV